MQKRFFSFGFVFVFIITVLSGCGSRGKFAEEKELLQNVAKTMNTLTAELEKVNSGKDVVKALNDFSAKMKTYKGAMEKMEKKYPKMKDPPKELEADVKAMKEATMKMMPLMMKMTKYAKDPDVMKAMADMKTVMQ